MPLTGLKVGVSRLPHTIAFNCIPLLLIAEHVFSHAVFERRNKVDRKIPDRVIRFRANDDFADA